MWIREFVDVLSDKELFSCKIVKDGEIVWTGQIEEEDIPNSYIKSVEICEDVDYYEDYDGEMCRDSNGIYVVFNV